LKGAALRIDLRFLHRLSIQGPPLRPRHTWTLRLVATRGRGHDRQPFMACGVSEPIVERDEGEPLVELALQIEAAGELHRVAGSQPVTKQQRAGLNGNVRRELDDDQRGEVVFEGSQRAVTFLDRERSFARPTDHCRRYFHFRETARRATIRLQQPADGDGAWFSHISFHQRAGVKVANQKRSLRS
jgi:hypothetical protein